MQGPHTLFSFTSLNGYQEAKETPGLFIRTTDWSDQLKQRRQKGSWIGGGQTVAKSMWVWDASGTSLSGDVCCVSFLELLQQWSGFNTRNVLSHSSGGWKSRSKCQGG